MRTFDHREFPLSRLLGAKGSRSVSVCIPARDEESTVGPVIDSVLAAADGHHQLADEVIVIDDRSIDSTAQVARSAGAKVVNASDYPALLQPSDSGWPYDSGLDPGTGKGSSGPQIATGKGFAMRAGLAASSGDIVAFLDADVRNPGAHFATGIVGPCLIDDRVALVKGTYERTLEGRLGEGGRVTELTAKPLIRSLFPDLAFLGQPLSGECAAPRRVFEGVFSLPGFPDGYGVEMAMLIAVHRFYGADRIAQVDLGTRSHRNRPLFELAAIAQSVVDVVLAEGWVPYNPAR